METEFERDFVILSFIHLEVQKKVYSCIKDKYSEARGTRGKVGLNGTKPHFEIPRDGQTHPLLSIWAP